MQLKFILMKQLIITILLFSLISVDTSVFGQESSLDTNHFYSKVAKTQFDTLKGLDFTWVIFQPINDTLSYTPFGKRHAFVEKLSDKQKALFYIWELERAVSSLDGTLIDFSSTVGFANFFYNYKDNFAETLRGLKLINDTAMINVLKGVSKVYVTKYKIINQKYNTGEWIYIQKQFKQYDKAFIDKHENTMKLLEDYVKLYTEDFVRFEN